jgi:hypothetical protein
MFITIPSKSENIKLQSISSEAGVSMQIMASSASPTPHVATSPTKSPAFVSAATSPIIRRINQDPNRVPLYNDERLPPGWHRKVSE